MLMTASCLVVSAVTALDESDDIDESDNEYNSIEESKLSLTPSSSSSPIVMGDRSLSELSNLFSAEEDGSVSIYMSSHADLSSHDHQPNASAPRMSADDYLNSSSQELFQVLGDGDEKTEFQGFSDLIDSCIDMSLRAGAGTMSSSSLRQDHASIKKDVNRLTKMRQLVAQSQPDFSLDFSGFPIHTPTKQRKTPTPDAGDKKEQLAIILARALNVWKVEELPSAKESKGQREHDEKLLQQSMSGNKKKSVVKELRNSSHHGRGRSPTKRSSREKDRSPNRKSKSTGNGSNSPRRCKAATTGSEHKKNTNSPGREGMPATESEHRGGTRSGSREKEERNISPRRSSHLPRNTILLDGEHVPSNDRNSRRSFRLTRGSSHNDLGISQSDRASRRSSRITKELRDETPDAHARVARRNSRLLRPGEADASQDRVSRRTSRIIQRDGDDNSTRNRRGPSPRLSKERDEHGSKREDRSSRHGRKVDEGDIVARRMAQRALERAHSQGKLVKRGASKETSGDEAVTSSRRTRTIRPKDGSEEPKSRHLRTAKEASARERRSVDRRSSKISRDVTGDDSRSRRKTPGIDDTEGSKRQWKSLRPQREDESGEERRSRRSTRENRKVDEGVEDRSTRLRSSHGRVLSTEGTSGESPLRSKREGERQTHRPSSRSRRDGERKAVGRDTTSGVGRTRSSSRREGERKVRGDKDKGRRSHSPNGHKEKGRGSRSPSERRKQGVARSPSDRRRKSDGKLLRGPSSKGKGVERGPSSKGVERGILERGISSRGLERGISSRGLEKGISSRGLEGEISSRGLEGGSSSRDLERGTSSRRLEGGTSSRGLERGTSSRRLEKGTSSRGLERRMSSEGLTRRPSSKDLATGTSSRGSGVRRTPSKELGRRTSSKRLVGVTRPKQGDSSSRLERGNSSRHIERLKSTDTPTGLGSSFLELGFSPNDPPTPPKSRDLSSIPARKHSSREAPNSPMRRSSSMEPPTQPIRYQSTHESSHGGIDLLISSPPFQDGIFAKDFQTGLDTTVRPSAARRGADAESLAREPARGQLTRKPSSARIVSRSSSRTSLKKKTSSHGIAGVTESSVLSPERSNFDTVEPLKRSRQHKSDSSRPSTHSPPILSICREAFDDSLNEEGAPKRPIRRSSGSPGFDEMQALESKFQTSNGSNSSSSEAPKIPVRRRSTGPGGEVAAVARNHEQTLNSSAQKLNSSGQYLHSSIGSFDGIGIREDQLMGSMASFGSLSLSELG